MYTKIRFTYPYYLLNLQMFEMRTGLTELQTTRAADSYHLMPLYLNIPVSTRKSWRLAGLWLSYVRHIFKSICIKNYAVCDWLCLCAVGECGWLVAVKSRTRRCQHDRQWEVHQPTFQSAGLLQLKPLQVSIRDHDICCVNWLERRLFELFLWTFNTYFTSRTRTNGVDCTSIKGHC